MTTARLLLVDGAYRAEQSVLSNGRTDRMDETAKAYRCRAVCRLVRPVLRSCRPMDERRIGSMPFDPRATAMPRVSMPDLLTAIRNMQRNVANWPTAARRDGLQRPKVVVRDEPIK
ncbi:hypothetical protein [Burkholderia sp. PU8-34]